MSGSLAKRWLDYWLYKAKWLYPGMRVKRWLFLAVLGALLSGLGVIITTQEKILSFLENKILQASIWSFGSFAFWAGLLTIALGIAIMLLGIRKSLGSIMDAVFPERDFGFAEAVFQKRHLQRGPRIVVVGGGTGLSVLLKGLKKYTSNITAIVTVADDGGSSGRLRGELGILPPGDIRNCMVALAEPEALMDELFQYRFPDGKTLEGHSMGNLLLAAMTNLTGSFDRAIKAMSKVLAIRGQVLPSTLENITLRAETGDGKVVVGESAISACGQAIKRVALEPEDCKPLPEALQAIKEADLVVLGPGSLYTSVLPNLLISEIAAELKAAKGAKVYVCNIMTQPGETEGYGAADHVQAILDHVGPGVVEHVIVNIEEVPKRLVKKYLERGARPVRSERKKLEKMGLQVVPEKLVYESDLVRHHPDKLSRAIIGLLFRTKAQQEAAGVLDFYLLGEWFKDRGQGK
ncbi:MAG: YvcK family protein [Clostridia bacterium]|nr:YvcK family protein [Clostridia bacterium]